MVLHLVRFRPMSTTAIPVPPILATLIGRIAAAVPGRARATFTELLIGAAVTRGGHVTDAILAVGLSRAWTTYYLLAAGTRPLVLAAGLAGAARGAGGAVRPAGLARRRRRYRGRAHLGRSTGIADPAQPHRQAEPAAVPARPGLSLRSVGTYEGSR